VSFVIEGAMTILSGAQPSSLSFVLPCVYIQKRKDKMMCFAPCVTASFCFSSFSLGSFFFFSLDINVCARTNQSPFVYLFPSYFSMVAHTGNSTMTTTTSTTLPTNNYLSPTLKMNLPQNLRM
jgi:hypothetical protein